MYAVIRSGGKQYRVAPGETVKVETLPGKVGGRYHRDRDQYGPQRHAPGVGVLEQPGHPAPRWRLIGHLISMPGCEGAARVRDRNTPGRSG